MPNNPEAIFTTGSKIFKNDTPLNPFLQPPDCANCTRDNRATGYISRYNPKTKSCECVPDPNIEAKESCEDLAQNLEESLGNYYQDGECCCSCPEFVETDCISRGWRYIRPQGLLDSGRVFGGCKCDCRDNLRLDNSFYIKESECPSFNGIRVWNDLTCECECERLPHFKNCEDPYIVGPNCQCTCPPDTVPPTGCPPIDGKQGIFSQYACECIYPCGPGLIPYVCKDGDGPWRPYTTEVTIGCAEPCKENEYLTSCDDNGFRHCCENGSVWSNEKKQCVPCESVSQNCDSVSQFNYQNCSCCPDGKIYDYGNNEFNLYNGECVCENVIDIYSSSVIPTSECIEPRFITDDCKCECGHNKVWGRSPIDPDDFDCLDIEDRCPEYDENGDPVGPVDSEGNPLYTRWDIYDLECQCAKGNIDVNECQYVDKFLNTQTCECDCPQGSSTQNGRDNEICICDENKVVAYSQFILDIPSISRLECLTCQQIHGPNSIYIPFAGGPQGRDHGRCVCSEGFIEQKTILAEDVSRRRCVSCENYTENGAWDPIEQKCGCAEGFTELYDEQGDFDCFPIPPIDFDTTPTPMPTPSPEPTEPTATPDPSTPVPTPEYEDYTTVTVLPSYPYEDFTPIETPEP